MSKNIEPGSVYVGEKNNTNFESVAIVTITFNSSHVIEQFINSLNKSEFII